MFQRKGFLSNENRSKISMIFLIIVMLTLASPGFSVPIPGFSNYYLNLTGVTDCTTLFNSAELAERNNHCYECKELFREPELNTLCRKDCYQTSYYQGCLDALVEYTNVQPIGSSRAISWNNYFIHKFSDIIDYLKSLPKSSQS